MKKITLEFSNDDARVIEYFLRTRYKKDKRTSLRKLCEIAIRAETANQAKNTALDFESEQE